jgi:catechol 2,3-dioxygenase-like lactoylglutathione lyase family enzyme
MSHLELVALIIRDYDAAIRFFVDVLQFDEMALMANASKRKVSWTRRVYEW